MKKIISRITDIFRWLKWVYVSNLRLKKEVRKGGGIIKDKVKVRIDGHIKIGKKVFIHSNGIDSNNRSQLFVSNGSTFSIGNHSGFTSASINCTCGITIGNYVKIGAGCLFLDTDFHASDWKLRCNPKTDGINAKSAPIVVDDHVFIGARSIICKGVHIGEHSVIASGSVVVKDIPANCIAGGNPCKVIKNLA